MPCAPSAGLEAVDETATPEVKATAEADMGEVAQASPPQLEPEGQAQAEGEAEVTVGAAPQPRADGEVLEEGEAEATVGAAAQPHEEEEEEVADAELAGELLGAHQGLTEARREAGEAAADAEEAAGEEQEVAGEAREAAAGQGAAEAEELDVKMEEGEEEEADAMEESVEGADDMQDAAEGVDGDEAKDEAADKEPAEVVDLDEDSDEADGAGANPARKAAKRTRRGSRTQASDSRANRIYAAKNGHSIADAKAFADFQSATEAEQRGFPHILASFHGWMKEGKAKKSADSYTMNVRMLMQHHGLSITSMATVGYFSRVRASKENATRNAVISAALKKFQVFVQQRGRPGEPWEARADPTDARFRLGGARLSLYPAARPASGKGCLAAHFLPGPKAEATASPTKREGKAASRAASPAAGAAQAEATASPVKREGKASRAASPAAGAAQAEAIASPAKREGKASRAASPAAGAAQAEATPSPAKREGKASRAASPAAGVAQAEATASPAKREGKASRAASPAKGAAQAEAAVSPAKADPKAAGGAAGVAQVDAAPTAAAAARGGARRAQAGAAGQGGGLQSLFSGSRRAPAAPIVIDGLDLEESEAVSPTQAPAAPAQPSQAPAPEPQPQPQPQAAAAPPAAPAAAPAAQEPPPAAKAQSAPQPQAAATPAPEQPPAPAPPAKAAAQASPAGQAPSPTQAACSQQAKAQQAQSQAQLTGLFAAKKAAASAGPMEIDTDDDDDVVISPSAPSSAASAAFLARLVPSTPGRPQASQASSTQQGEETPNKPVHPLMERRTPEKALPAPGTERPLAELPPAQRQDVERLRQAVTVAARARDYGEAERRMRILQWRCADLGCAVPPRLKERGPKAQAEQQEQQEQQQPKEQPEGDVDPVDRLAFAVGILKEKFPMVWPDPNAPEDDSEIMAEDRPPPSRLAAKRARKEQDPAVVERDPLLEERERAQAMKAALAKIEDAPYEDLNRFPSVAETFRQYLQAQGLEAEGVENEVRSLHELFAQDEKSLPAMASQAYAEAVSSEPLHAQVVANFAKFWKSHKGPFAPAPHRAERGLEVRTRATHGIPLAWGVRVVQRTRKEDLVILTSPEGVTRYAAASQLHNLPVMRSPEFLAERARRKAMSEWEQQEEIRQAGRPSGPVAAVASEEEKGAKADKAKTELEEGLKAIMAGGASSESRKKVLGVLFRQQVACAGCGKAGRDASGAEVDDGLVAEDSTTAEAAVERTRWTSYEDVPDATEEEKATYPAVLATFYQRGYPYTTGVRKLMEIHKKRPLDMATPEFQRLVRHDPENASCNGFLNSAILYLRKFREEGGFEDLVDVSTVDPQKLQTLFTPDFSRGWGKAQESFDDLQVEVPLELLMADATQEWQRELQEKLDDENYIQEDVDASGHRPVALSITLLPDASEEDWALWPRILARYEAMMKQASEEVKGVKREAEAAELFGALKELIEEHGKSPEAMASRKYVKMVRSTYPQQREKAISKFAEFWAAHKDEEFPEPKVHSFATNKYRLPERRLVEQAKRLASEWTLPEGWAVRLGKDGRVIRITGPGKGEVFQSREAAMEAVDAKSKKQAEEAKALQKQIVSRQDARISHTVTQAGLQQRLREALAKEDYGAARQAQAELQKVQEPQGEDSARPAKRGSMPIMARDLQAPSAKGGGRGSRSGKGNGKGAKLFAKRKAEKEDKNAAPLKVRKAQSLNKEQQQQAAACELTLRAHEWRVLGVRAQGGPMLPLGSTELQRVRPELATVVLAYVDEEVRECKRLHIVESWGLDETWTVTIRVRRSGDQVTARRSDGKVFFHKHELVCERQAKLRQQLRTNAAECIKGITGFLSAAASGEAVWELEAKGSFRLSGLYVRASTTDGNREEYEKVRALTSHSSSPETVRVRRCAEAWEFVEASSGEVLARTAEETLGSPFDSTRLRLSAEEAMDVRGSLLPSDQVGLRAAALLAQPRGPVCRFCESGHGSHITKDKDTSKLANASKGVSRAERLVQYQARLRELQARRAVAPRTLQDMVGGMVSKLRHLLGGQLPDALTRRKCLRVGTMCSGTDAPVLVARALERVLSGQSSGLTFEHVFSAEQDASKQEFIKANFPDCPLIFQDVCQLGRLRAYDSLSRKPQPVPGELDVLLAGFSCKDLSMMNSYRKTLAEMGTSGSTLRGVLDYVERYRPRIVLLENVWAIAKANSCGFRQVDLVLEGLKRRGYAAGYKLLNSCDYYVPQIRHRVWMWGLRLDAAPVGRGGEAEVVSRGERASRTIEPRYHAILRELEEPCALHFDDYMLDDDHPDVRAHFQKMSAMNRVSLKQKRSGTKKDWTQKYGSHRTSNDYQYERPYTAVRDAGFLQVLNEREKELLDLKCLDVLNEQGKDPRTHPMLWELTQSVERVPGTRVRPDRQNYATCILPGMLWHSSRHRWVLGIEKLALQGVFSEDLKDTNFPQKLLGDLAGNAFTTTVCAVNLLTALVCADEFCPQQGA